MHTYPRTAIDRLAKYLKQLEIEKPKPATEIGLNELSNLMNKVGFSGPLNKPGTARGFSHELLKTNSRLIDGQFTVHIVHGSKVPVVRYRDVKQYVLPYVEEVMALIDEQKLIQEEDPNVTL
jgi:hypothetical protein